MKVEYPRFQEEAEQLWRELDGLDWSSHQQAICGIIRDAFEEAATTAIAVAMNSAASQQLTEKPPQPVPPEGEREEFAKHAPKFNSKTGQVSCKCGASLSFVSSVGPAAKEALIEAVAYQYGSHLFWLAAQPAPPQPEGERELIAKTLYELHSGNSLSSWETHAPWLREMRYREADVILAALAPLPSVQPEGERVREALQDLFNNEFCSCRKTEDRCVLCRIAISEARAALAATPAPEESERK